MTLGRVDEFVCVGTLPLSLSAKLLLKPVDLSLGIPPAKRPPRPMGLPLLMLLVLGAGALLMLAAGVLEDSPFTFPERNNRLNSRKVGSLPE